MYRLRYRLPSFTKDTMVLSAYDINSNGNMRLRRVTLHNGMCAAEATLNHQCCLHFLFNHRRPVIVN